MRTITLQYNPNNTLANSRIQEESKGRQGILETTGKLENLKKNIRPD